MSDWSRVADLEYENKKLRAALKAVVQWADDLGYFSEQGTVLAPVFKQAKEAIEPSP